MILGVPRETKEGERRVSLLPAAVQEITAEGHDVRVETRAGKGVGAQLRHGADVHFTHRPARRSQRSGEHGA